MAILKPLPDKTPAEVKLVQFDFANELSERSKLTGATAAKALVRGSDTGAATLTVGTPAIVGGVVKFLVGGGTDENTYSLTVTAEANNGEIHELAASIAVSATAA
jgi:hypothetical protein